MPKNRAVLELSPSRIELTVFDGSTAASPHAQRIETVDTGDNWTKTLEPLAGPLAALVKAAGATGLETTILYHAPTSTVLTTAVPATTGPKQGLLAARLALADAANRPLATNPHDLDRVWRDADPDASTQGGAQSAHTLGIAEAEETAIALVRAAQAAGLKPSALFPAEAIGLASAVDAALEGSKTGTAIALYLGEHLSTLAAATKGRLRFVRRIGIGTEMLVDAIAREIKPTTAGAAPVTLTRVQAAALLFGKGIPVRGQAFDTDSGLDADAVLPLVQPLLQRCIVELKQSLRFGLEEGERAGAKLFVRGMGARIGRLSQLIADQASLTLSDPPSTTSEFPASTQAGLIHEWISGRQIGLKLVPSALGREQAARRTRRGMLVGFAAAALLIAWSAIDIRMALAAQNKKIEAARVRLESARPIMDLNRKMLGAQAGVANARQRMAGCLSMATPWDAALAALSLCTPDTVKISECDMTFDRGRPVCRLTGQTPMPTSGDANAVMRSFLDALATIPLVKSTRLGATQRAESDNGPIQSFEMTITFVDLPQAASDEGAGIASIHEPEGKR